jgi:hypothetical protein
MISTSTSCKSILLYYSLSTEDDPGDTHHQTTCQCQNPHSSLGDSSYTAPGLDQRWGFVERCNIDHEFVRNRFPPAARLAPIVVFAAAAGFEPRQSTRRTKSSSWTRVRKRRKWLINVSFRRQTTDNLKTLGFDSNKRCSKIINRAFPGDF